MLKGALRVGLGDEHLDEEFSALTAAPPPATQVGNGGGNGAAGRLHGDRPDHDGHDHDEAAPSAASSASSSSSCSSSSSSSWSSSASSGKRRLRRRAGLLDACSRDRGLDETWLCRRRVRSLVSAAGALLLGAAAGVALSRRSRPGRGGAGAALEPASVAGRGKGHHGGVAPASSLHSSELPLPLPPKGDEAGYLGDGPPATDSSRPTDFGMDDDNDVRSSLEDDDDDVDTHGNANSIAAGHHANTTNASTQTIPPLSSLVKGTSIIGDVSFLLDFAIVDFPKCGTTFLMNYIGQHSDETYINKGEVCSMDRHRPFKVVNRYYPHKAKHYLTPDGTRHVKFGLKCPEELETEYALSDYATHFPTVKFIVAVRHPVLWFQSYYNFRAYSSYPLIMPHTSDLIGPCRENYPYVPWNCSHHCPEKNMKVCTHRAMFHRSLSRLGKTPMNTKDEIDLLGHHGMSIVPTQSKVFLMENRQIVMEDPSSRTFPQDLRDFLQLSSDLPPLHHFEKKPERYSNTEALKQQIHICDAEHDRVREVLVQHGKNAARWITEYFLKSPDVVTTQRERFVALLDDWGLDPCDDPVDRLRVRRDRQ